LLRNGAPLELSGLTAETTCGVSRRRLTVESTALLFAALVSLPCASRTSGLLPFACWGMWSCSRSVAFVDPVPGRVRLSLVLLPEACPAETSATVAISHAPITGQWYRQQKRPMK
jgi:hypothetical protein